MHLLGEMQEAQQHLNFEDHSCPSKRISKHRYGTLKKQGCNELAKHFGKERDFTRELDSTILQKDIEASGELSFE